MSLNIKNEYVHELAREQSHRPRLGGARLITRVTFDLVRLARNS